MACDTLEQFVRRTASTLVDKDHVTWTESDIADAVGDGLAAISSHRPEVFIQDQDVNLVAGTRQKLPIGIISIVSDIKNICVAADGTTTEGPDASLITEDDKRALAYISSRACAPTSTGSKAEILSQQDATNSCKQYQLVSFVFDPRNPSELQVTPAVPVGVSPKIRIVAKTCPPCYTWPESKDAELPCSYRAELREYVLYTLLSKQRESEAALSNAARHLTNFYNMLGIKYRQEARYGSGYFLGVKGDGDPAVIRGA